ncbi:MAG: hypothetical protein ACI4T5_11445 [Prevotella sp.]
MRSVINTHVTKEVMNLLDTTPTEMAQATESAISQISMAAKILLDWQYKNDEEQEVEVNLYGDNIAEKCSSVIDLAEIHAGYGDEFNSHINYVNISGAYYDWSKLLVTEGDEDIYILFDTDRIGTAQATTLTVPNRDGEKHDYAAVNIKQLDLQSAWRVMQYLSMAVLDCTSYWRIYEE